MCCSNSQLCRALPFLAISFSPRMHSIVDAFFSINYFRMRCSISCVLRSVGGLGPAHAFGGVGFLLVAWFRFSFLPFRWFCSGVVGLRFVFFFLTCLLSLGKVCVCWIVLPPFFSAAFCSCLGLLRFRCRSFSSHCFHFIFIFILITLVRTLTTVPPYWGGVCVCVCVSVCVRTICKMHILDVVGCPWFSFYLRMVPPSCLACGGNRGWGGQPFLHLPKGHLRIA